MLTILHFLHRIVFRARLKNKKISFPKSADERMDKEKNRDEKQRGLMPILFAYFTNSVIKTI